MAIQMAEYRVDASKEKLTYTRTDEGFLIVSGYPTRTGVFLYRNDDGSVRRELRHPDDVLDPKSLQTMAGKPLTIQTHPSEMLTPQNVDKYAVGSASNEIQVVGDGLIKVVYNVHKNDGIEAILHGDCQQISLGYSCKPVPESGFYKGEPYDYRQTDIRYNHHTALPKGRAGEMCRMRLDSADDHIAYQVFDSDDSAETPMSTVKLTIDSAEYADIPADLAPLINSLVKARDEAIGRADAAETEAGELKESLESIKNENEFLQNDIELLQNLITDAKDDEDEAEDEEADDDEAEDEDTDEEEKEDAGMECPKCGATKPCSKKGCPLKKMEKEEMTMDAADLEQIRADAQAAAYAEISEQFQIRADVDDIAYAFGCEIKLDEGISAIDMKRAIVKACRPRLDSSNYTDAQIATAYDIIHADMEEVAEEHNSKQSNDRKDAATEEADKLQTLIAGARSSARSQARADGGCGMSERDKKRMDRYKQPAPISKMSKM